MLGREYLYDKVFLQEFDINNHKVQYVRLTVLDWEDNPIQHIEGQVTGGNININGKSSIRRTGSLTLVVPQVVYNITDVESLISINKKIKVELGFLNNTKYYTDYQILWFKQGIFIITNANISKSTSDISISLSLKDKMVLLNGECGGQFTHETTLSPEINDVDGSKTFTKIKTLIETAVVQIGGIPQSKVFIFDIEDRIKNTVKWNGSNSLWIKEDNSGNYQFSNIEPLYKNSYEEYQYNSNIGYQYTDFSYPVDKELIMNPGDTVVTLLDKIKNTLGNYEYFFDIDGNFIFQQIKDYVNDGSSLDNLTDAINDKYLINTSKSNKSQYTLSSQILTNISNAPVYENVKNDLILWGKQKQGNGSKKDICYHLIIDEKPIEEKEYQYVEFYKRKEEDFYRAKKGEVLKDEKGNIIEDPDPIKTSDWRNQIYFDAIINGEYNFLSTEVVEYWPQIYDVQHDCFRAEYETEGLKWLNNLPYFLDMIDTNAVNGPIADIGISKIGRRPKVLKDDDVNCLFTPRFPNLIYIQAGSETTKKERDEAMNSGSGVVQLPQSMTQSITLGAYLYPAYDAIRSVLHETSSYNETINISCIPIYHLEPNIRITVNDNDTGISGDYLIQSISLPLAFNGDMTITAQKAIERI